MDVFVNAGRHVLIVRVRNTKLESAFAVKLIMAIQYTAGPFYRYIKRC